MDVTQLSEQVHTLLARVHELELAASTAQEHQISAQEHQGGTTTTQQSNGPDPKMQLLEKEARVLQLEERLQVD